MYICCRIVRNKQIFDELIIQLVCRYIYTRLFTSVSVKVADIYLAAWGSKNQPHVLEQRAGEHWEDMG